MLGQFGKHTSLPTEDKGKTGKEAVPLMHSELQSPANVYNTPIIVTPTNTQENHTGYVITGARQKLNLGKCAKHNINIVREEVWLHTSVLKKYTQRVTLEPQLIRGWGNQNYPPHKGAPYGIRQAKVVITNHPLAELMQKLALGKGLIRSYC